VCKKLEGLREPDPAKRAVENGGNKAVGSGREGTQCDDGGTKEIIWGSYQKRRIGFGWETKTLGKARFFVPLIRTHGLDLSVTKAASNRGII
jgi:hypothetical protein